MKLSILFHLQTNGQTKYMNYKLEQHLQFFVDHKQKDQLEWLVTVESVINNKYIQQQDISIYSKLQKEANIRKRKKQQSLQKK